MRRTIGVIGLATVLAACAQERGAPAGGFAAPAGNATRAAPARGTGTLLSALTPGERLDRADLQFAERTSQQALEYNRVGQTSEWRNPQNGNSGSVTPTRTWQRDDGTSCREYQQTVMAAGRQQAAIGTACRLPDGSWRVVQG